MGVSELLELCKKETGIKFKITNGDIVIATEVEGVNENKITFNGGYVQLWANSEIKEKSKPGNTIVNCSWCYSISRGGKLLGYIYKPQDRWKIKS